MLKVLSSAFLFACLLVGCTSIPSVNSDTISTSPASSHAFANAKRAVQACRGLPNGKAMFDRFEAIGIRSSDFPDEPSITKLPGGQTKILTPTVLYDDGELIVQASVISTGEGRCFVGLRGMTPEQSFQLASILARHFDLATNAEVGQGLSDHVVQAWQARTFPNVAILVAAHKTWPWDRGNWPTNQIGAAVTLYHRGLER